MILENSDRTRAVVSPHSPPGGGWAWTEGWDWGWGMAGGAPNQKGVMKDECLCSQYSPGSLRSRSIQQVSSRQESPGIFTSPGVPGSPTSPNHPVNRSPCADVGQLHKGPAWVGTRAQMPWTVTYQPWKNTAQQRLIPLVYLNTNFLKVILLWHS